MHAVKAHLPQVTTWQHPPAGHTGTPRHNARSPPSPSTPSGHRPPRLGSHNHCLRTVLQLQAYGVETNTSFLCIVLQRSSKYLKKQQVLYRKDIRGKDRQEFRRGDSDHFPQTFRPSSFLLFYGATQSKFQLLTIQNESCLLET